jgi:RHS repeat-associated protein
MLLSARLLESATGRPVTGQTVTFDVGGSGNQTVSAVTGADGTATTTRAPAVLPGTVSLTLTFAGGGGFAGSSASLLLPVLRDDTALVYTGKPALANGQAQTVTARLTDGEDGTPIPGEPLSFTFGSATVTATTGADGTATASLTVPAAQPAGAAAIAITFAGDAYRRPAHATAPVLVYQASSFVIWGGNTPGLTVGQRVNFWGSQWAQQVTGGDYAANPSFKGFAIPKASPIVPCEPTAHSTGTPQLDAGCWTAKPGNSSPPATIGSYIGAIVSTSIAKSGATIYGNIAATVVLQVDPGSSYGPDPGHPGFGTVVAVIEDGARLFSKAAARKPPAGKLVESAALPAIATGTRQFFLYTPELNLLAETELTANAHPLIASEYVWWNGHPVAQVDATGTTSWTFTDHLGTPILQTSAQQGIVWRAEYEPFGTIYALRSYDKHQPLRLPGQEAEQLGLEANGVTDRSYNVHRWYRGEWGRYTQADPLGLRGGVDLYSYVLANPLRYTDPLGLYLPESHGGLAYYGTSGSCLRGDAETLRDLTSGVDDLPGSQLPENSRMHSMCPPGVAPEQGLQQIRQYIKGELAKCTLPSLAKALHAIQDGFAPGHRGCQTWRGMPTQEGGESWKNAIRHFLGDVGVFSSDPLRATMQTIADWCTQCRCAKSTK